jgi:predicted nucleic acid-binding protein
MKIVSDSSPLIALAKIGRLNLLEHEIIVPKAVFEEITRSWREYTRKLYTWGKNRVSVVKNRQAVEYLELVLDRGEAEVIVLAEELKADAVLIDDLKARKTANLRGLTVVGTIGVLLDAKERGLVDDVKPLLDELIRKKIRISRELYNHALELAQESRS